MGRHENRLSNPQAQTGDCALILMPIGLGIVSRVVPPDRRNGSFEVAPSEMTKSIKCSPVKGMMAKILFQ